MFFTEYNLVHLFLSLTTLSIFYFSGKKMEKAKSRQTYWKNAIVPIVVYTLNFGLRYNRGTDYMVYESLFDRFVNGVAIESSEPLWNLILYITAFVLQLPYQCLIMFMSFVFIVCSLFYLRNHRKKMGMSMVMFLICSSLAENLARWFMAFGFLLVSLSYIETKKYKQAIIWAIMSFFVHFGFAICIIPLISLMFIKRRLFSPYIGMAILIISFLFFDLSKLGVIGNLIQMIDMGERYASYQDDIDVWFKDEEGAYGLGLTTTIKYLVFLFLCTKLKRKEQLDVGIYNIAMIGLSFAFILHSLELTYRIGIIYEWFLTLLLPYLLYRFNTKTTNKIKYSKLYAFILVLFIISSIVTYSKISLGDPDLCALYIWNK